MRSLLSQSKLIQFIRRWTLGLSFNANDDNEFVYGDEEPPPNDDDDSPPRGTAGAPRYHDVDSADG